MKILYIGQNSQNSTSRHRADALTRIGHLVHIVNPYAAFKEQLRHPIIGRIHYYSGYTFIQKILYTWIESMINKSENYDLIWVNSGELIGSKSVLYLKSFNVPVVLYNNDDPTGGRDGNRFKTLLKALPLYDMCVVMRNQNIKEFYKIGAKKVLRLHMSYDEIIHKPFERAEEIPEKFKSDIAFIGTWMRGENRDQFISELIESGINVSIWGDRWEKSTHWNKIKPFFKGKSLSGRDYVAAIQGAKICLGMLSKGNRDLHTTRSFEIPYSGGLLCAERTIEHLQFYKEGEEALFWSDAKECIEICKKILENDMLGEHIRLSGMKKVRVLGVGNEDVCRSIIHEIGLITHK